MNEPVETEAAWRKLWQAVGRVKVIFPQVAALLAALDIRFDGRVGTAAVAPSGRLLVSPAFAEGLTVRQLTFVVAHEAYHVLYGVFDRVRGRATDDERWLVNVAHDFIVNEKVREVLWETCPDWQDYLPEGALWWSDYGDIYRWSLQEMQPPLDRFSLESLVVELRRIRNFLPREDAHDVLLPERERELFPDESESVRRARRDSVSGTCSCAAGGELQRAVEHLLSAKGGGGGEELVAAKRGQYATPWECVLQKWMDDSAPPARSWAHASRRGADRTDIVQPGRRTDGYMINILLDTSGSMTDLLPSALGMIQAFGRSSGVCCARIVQCDSDVASDEMVEIDDLSALELKWVDGGGMDPPGLLRFAEDGSVESVLVITDGCIDIPPRESIPYEVLWFVLSADGDTSHFRPDYGRVVGVPTEDLEA